MRGALGPELPAAVAEKHGLTIVLARAVVRHVLDAVVLDLQRMADALAKGDPDLHLATRVAAQRLRFACERVLRLEAPP